MSPVDLGAHDQALIDLLADSRCAQDHLNLVQHIYNRSGPQMRLLQLAERDRNHRKAPSLWPQAVRHLTQLAQAGDGLAAFHLGRWARVGIGRPVNHEEAIQWCEMGAYDGHTACMITLARLIVEQDPQQARKWLQQAQSLGDPIVHTHWGLCFPEEAEAQLAQGVALQEPSALLFWSDRVSASQPADALKALYQAAEAGITEACIRLCFVHHEGRLGLPASPALALHWAAEAATLGSPFGCGMYGRLLVDRNPSMAISQMRRSAMLGETFYVYDLARLLMMQGKRPNQLREGLHWLRHGALSGDAMCMDVLGDMLKSGHGCKANPKQAFHWHEKSAALGNADAQVSVAVACMRGDVVPQDKVRAFNLLNLAGLQEHADALYLQGIAYEQGDGTDKDPVKAHECQQQAAELGSLRATLQVGLNHFWGEGTCKDVPEVVKWIKRAAALGLGDAQVFLGYMFRSGSGVTQNKRLARKWLQRAADANHASGQYELARLLESMNEVGLQQDIRRWMSAAAAQGHEEAMAWIKARWPEQPEWLKKLKTEV